MTDQRDQPIDVVAIDNDQLRDMTDERQRWSLDDASDHLGITVNAVRQRIKRGTLDAERTPDGWVVFMPTDQETTPASGHRPTGQLSAHARHATNQPGDQPGIAPLVDLVAEQTRQIAELSAAAALWQERARFLGERLAALEAGPMPADVSHAAPESVPDPPVSHDQPTDQPVNDAQTWRETPEAAPHSTGIRRWWRRVLGYEG